MKRQRKKGKKIVALAMSFVLMLGVGINGAPSQGEYSYSVKVSMAEASSTGTEASATPVSSGNNSRWDQIETSPLLYWNFDNASENGLQLAGDAVVRDGVLHLSDKIGTKQKTYAKLPALTSYDFSHGMTITMDVNVLDATEQMVAGATENNDFVPFFTFGNGTMADNFKEGEMYYTYTIAFNNILVRDSNSANNMLGYFGGGSAIIDGEYTELNAVPLSFPYAFNWYTSGDHYNHWDAITITVAEDGTLTTYYNGNQLQRYQNENFTKILDSMKYAVNNYLGASYGGAFDFAGEIDNFAIYTTALSADEVEKIGRIESATEAPGTTPGTAVGQQDDPWYKSIETVPKNSLTGPAVTDNRLAPDYFFPMDKDDTNVVAVARGNESEYGVPSLSNEDEYYLGIVPTEETAETIGAVLRYSEGKNGNALYLDQNKFSGAKLKGIDLGEDSWSVSFWVKVPDELMPFCPLFFTCPSEDKIGKDNMKFLEIFRSPEGWLDSGFVSPCIWTRNDEKSEYAWYGYQNDAGKWAGDEEDVRAAAIKENEWVYITLVIDTSDTYEYGAVTDEEYVKGPHAWTYVNGELFGHGALANGMMSPTNQFFLGINRWDVPLKAYYDDVALWNKTLSSPQVKKIYEAELAGKNLTELSAEEASDPQAPTEEPSDTQAPTEEPSDTQAHTEEPSDTKTPTDEPTMTPAPTAEPTVTPASTAEATMTPAPTAEATMTPAPTAEPAVTPAPTTKSKSDATDVEDKPVAAKVKSLKVTNKKKGKVVISLKKSGAADGYQIQYAKNKKFTKSKKSIVTKKTTYTLNKLKKKATYYFRARAYVKDSSGKKVYGKWSTVKKLKIKK